MLSEQDYIDYFEINLPPDCAPGIILLVLIDNRQQWMDALQHTQLLSLGMKVLVGIIFL